MYKIRLQKNITILFIFIVMLSFSYWLANSFGMKWGVLAIIGFSWVLHCLLVDLG
ncbi:putative membrane protein [Escherichia coli DEC8B]|nr:putative membrane protein [Escherichia coli DEC8B]